MSTRLHMTRRRALAAIGATAAIPLASARAAGVAKIGTLCPLTGSGGSFGPTMEAAVRKQIAIVNGLGGAGGFQLVGVYENSETDPNAAVVAAKKLISVDGVSALLGEWGSGETLAVSPFCISGKVVQFTSGGDDKITDQDHGGFVFRTECGGVLWGEALAQAARRVAGAKTAAVASIQASYALAYTSNFRSSFQKLGGTLVGEPVVYAASATSYRGELDRILAGNPDLVCLIGYTPDTVIMIKEAFRAGATARWLVPGFVGLDPEFIKAVGPEAAEGVVIADPALDKTGPAYRSFVDVVGGEKEGLSYAAQTFDQAALVALAIEAMKKSDGASVRDGIRKVTAAGGKVVSNVGEGLKALRSGDAIKYQGVSSTCSFDAKGNITSGNFTFYAIKDGKADAKESRAVSL